MTFNDDVKEVLTLDTPHYLGKEFVIRVLVDSGSTGGGSF